MPTSEPTQEHFNATRLRTHTWDRLKTAVSDLAAAKKGKKEAVHEVDALLQDLYVIEQYWAFPGREAVNGLMAMMVRKEHAALETRVLKLVRTLVSGQIRLNTGEHAEHALDHDDDGLERPRTKYFEVLFVDDLNEKEEHELKANLAEVREPNDPFTYDAIVVPTVQDALIALLFNSNIQACVIRYGMPFASPSAKGFLKDYIRAIKEVDLSDRNKADMGPLLGKLMRWFRPEVDRYYVTDTPVSDLKDSTVQNFRRIFYRQEDHQELHLTILRGVQDKYDTPFFTALMDYSRRPMGVFHAMPISRGNSVFKSRWIQDFGDFYGRNLFLAETSSTSGGLDSLLQPTGPLKKAQERAARAFGSQFTYFATNGTSTSNKIVLQALVEPHDMVLIDRDCHKSHHYGLVLSGAYPVYLDSYPLPEFSMYGAVPLETIREKLLELKRAGRLQHVKMLLLTNCTFDGVVYNVQRVMEQVLAIKPDMVFLWDEAWFAFAGFSYIFKQRTAMFSAARLHRKYHSDAYREEYKAHIASLKKGEEPRMPDPDKVRIRVFATQSTHKTLTSLRQGSMIHIWDEDFKRKSEDSFHEAYMAHTTTSPNYQILASLDVGRRQVEFEGYELVEKAIEQGMLLRHKINDHPKLRRYFDIVTLEDLVPAKYRPSGLKEYYSKEKGWNRIEEAWAHDEFAVDPTKINLYTGKTGVDGDTFKNQYLMDKHHIQVNKTSRNSVLFMTNIGTTRGSVAYLIKVLLTIADELEARNNALNHAEKQLHVARIRSLTQETPPLPDFSRFHDSFRAVPGVPGGDLRKAYFLSYSEVNCEYVKIRDCQGQMREGRELVSASFVIPYPPGFPVLVPGQVVSKDILDFLIAIDVKEIHGYREDLGLRVFNGHALGRQRTGTAMGGMRISGNGASASTQGPSAKKVSTHERGRSREKK
ncbi:MAG: aminotransferase class I/II-fold pyridoxal phosphate-dependent enzyme [Flavobacteriales bacterium]|nr:aminotransferase class I/II-fold pyridoxal phosphate-dependent enzyme [Flavobacteriales bacterium]